jgi:hypothetical protein
MHALNYGGAGADMRRMAHGHGPAERRPRSDVHMIADLAVVIYRRAGVDQGVRADRSIGLDHGARHDLHSFSQPNTCADYGGRVNDL